MTDPLKLSRVSTAEVAEGDYFETNPPPKDIARIAESTRNFVTRHLKDRRRVVLVTSGGTTVPLENQTVRFIDNFSAGTRGATSAEYFLENDYAVVFLHRKFSLLPYSRHYSHSTNCFLDYMSQDAHGRVYVKDEYQHNMQAVFQKYQNAKDKQLLLLLSFTTVTEYLWSLREVAYALQPLGSAAIFYLAAAVSDFFVPKDRLAEHKIQSSDPSAEKQTGTGPNTSSASAKKLIIDLDPVPKFLKRLVDGWAPHAMIVSFKLETDPALLISKAKGALERYSHHLVIGNLLSTRSYEVVMVSRGGEEWIRVPAESRSEASMPHVSGSHNTIDIESLIIPAVTRLHDSLLKRECC